MELIFKLGQSDIRIQVFISVLFLSNMTSTCFLRIRSETCSLLLALCFSHMDRLPVTWKQTRFFHAFLTWQMLPHLLMPALCCSPPCPPVESIIQNGSSHHCPCGAWKRVLALVLNGSFLEHVCFGVVLVLQPVEVTWDRTRSCSVNLVLPKLGEGLLAGVRWETELCE